ncbi:hypothetical protein LJB89_01645 [Tyzzerella sp. OttesenSCG-928-J15]|nr:hypothetical protein [Tyzzerella sp. OttesenSCG-928-J15]
MDMQIVQRGLYTIKDDYFQDFKSKYLPDNKQENRPYYYAFEDKQGIIWFIPISSQVANYAAKIERDKVKYGECLYYHIDKIKGDDSVFLIGNMFPATSKYIKKAFTIAGVPYIVKNTNLIKKLHTKSTKYLRLVRQGNIKPNVDILSIEQDLLSMQN